MISTYVMKESPVSFSRTKIRLAVIGVTVGLGGGALCLLLAPGFWFCAWCLQDARLNEISTAIAYLTLPLLLAGGWCLDWYETLTRRK